MKGKALPVIAGKVIEEVLEIWDKAKIPTMTKINANLKLVKLFNKWRNLEKSKKKNNKQELENRDNFILNLDTLFDIVSSKWEKEIQDDRLRTKEAKAEDLKFLKDQREQRQMFLDKEDINYQAAHLAKNVRLYSDRKRKIAEQQRKEEDAKSDKSVWNNEDQDEKTNESDCDIIVKQKKKETVTINLPRKIFSDPNICSMTDRTQLSTNTALGVVASVIKAGGGDLNDFDISKSTVKRSRDRARKEEYERFYREFKPPKHSILC